MKTLNCCSEIGAPTMRNVAHAFFIGVLLTAVSCQIESQGYVDPVAREIAKLIEHTENSNVVIASDEKLEHLEKNDRVPVRIYYHSLCRADKRYCIKQRTIPERTVHRNRVIFSTSKKTEKSFVREWNQDDHFHQDTTNPSFLSQLRILAQMYSTGRTTPYYWIMKGYESEVDLKQMYTSEATKINNINMYAVQVSKTGESQFFLAQPWAYKIGLSVCPLAR
jgi:hypothetical protein